MMGAAGAAVMMLLAKIPYVGWLVVVLVVLTGIGAVMAARMDRLRGRG
jgi:Flp pilus assembly protein TadB